MAGEIMKKSKLIIEYDFDFELLGILSSARGYKLAWEINQVLGIQLIKQPDLVVGFKNNEEKSFSFFAHETQLNRLKLFKNKPSEQESGKYFLIPEFPHYDFIILAAMEEQYPHQNIIHLIRLIADVQLVASIPLEGLKSKSNFIF
ncbi:MAG TPA: IPExxxVDY family protein [Chryseolinea sp.]|nr:IPExxxVDY family protein [Chryseolinea sp.]